MVCRQRQWLPLWSRAGASLTLAERGAEPRNPEIIAGLMRLIRSSTIFGHKMGLSDSGLKLLLRFITVRID